MDREADALTDSSPGEEEFAVELERSLEVNDGSLVVALSVRTGALRGMLQRKLLQGQPNSD